MWTSTFVGTGSCFQHEPAENIKLISENYCGGFFVIVYFKVWENIVE
jgi:hypothetical protein